MRARLVTAALAGLLAAPPLGCMTAVSFTDLDPFGSVGSREWLTTTYFVGGVQHDSHTFVVSSRSNHCAQAEAYRTERAPVANAYWSWVAANVGWDVVRGDAALGEGAVAVEDPAARRAAWQDRTRGYVAAAGELWDEWFEARGQVVYVQFHRGRTYPAADRAEHDSPLPPAADGEGEILVGDHGLDGPEGQWRWAGAVGRDVGNPYVVAAESLAEQPSEDFEGLAAVWSPRGSGEWFDAVGGTAEMGRRSVHSWDLDIRDGALEDASGADAGGFELWGNYYRCFLDYGEMEAGPPVNLP